MFLSAIQNAYWIFVYDNLNIHLVARHEHEGKKFRYMYQHFHWSYVLWFHNVMQNTTARLAVEVQKLPPFPFEWTDTTPQKNRLTVKVDDILASEEDAVISMAVWWCI